MRAGERGVRGTQASNSRESGRSGRSTMSSAATIENVTSPHTLRVCMERGPPRPAVWEIGGKITITRNYFRFLDGFLSV